MHPRAGAGALRAHEIQAGHGRQARSGKPGGERGHPRGGVSLQRASLLVLQCAETRDRI